METSKRKRKYGNSEGSITYMKGRRKPYRVRVTVGIKYDEKKEKYVPDRKDLGCFRTRKEASDALNYYNNNKYDIDKAKITFKEAAEEFIEAYSKKLKGKSSIRTILSAFSYCVSIYDVPLVKLHAKQLMDMFKDCYKIDKDGKKKEASNETKERVKSFLNLFYDQCVIWEYTDSNYARNFKISDVLDATYLAEKSKQYNSVEDIFTPDEINTLWNNIDKITNVDLVLIQTYTGCRAEELVSFTLNNINLDKGYMIGGVKTEAGYDRVIPIHNDIMPLIKKRYNQALEMNSNMLVNDNESEDTTMSYDKYYKRYNKIMECLGMEHTTHDSRDTFITCMKHTKGYDEQLLKRIVGHKTYDTTERYYTTRYTSELVEAVNRLDFKSSDWFREW